MRWNVLAVGVMLFLAAGAARRDGMVFAAGDEDGSRTERKAEFLDREVPIPSWGRDVADNGCRPHDAPIPFSREALTSLTEIPSWQLIAHEVGKYSVRATLDPPETYLKSLEPLDAELRTLTLLHVLWDGLGRDGLHTYFYLTAGRTAPAVRDALQAAGLVREHALFTEAMALFGATYPVDDEVRSKPFGYETATQDLNPFDLRLMAISKEFGSRERWMEIIVGYVNRTPTLWKRTEAVRATLSDVTRLEYLTGALLSRVDFWQPFAAVEQALRGLTEPQRTLLVISAFNGEFENGGVDQFFYNSEGAIAPEVADALAAIGLERQADLLKRAIAMFKQPYPRDTEQRREAYFHDHDAANDWDRQLSELTDAFYALDGGPQVTHLGGDLQIDGGPGLRHAMLVYAGKHSMLPC